MNEQQVKQLLNKHNLLWEDFTAWMFGQTVGMAEDGTTQYYEWDVERFVRSRT